MTSNTSGLASREARNAGPGYEPPGPASAACLPVPHPAAGLRRRLFAFVQKHGPSGHSFLQSLPEADRRGVAPDLFAGALHDAEVDYLTRRIDRVRDDLARLPGVDVQWESEPERDADFAAWFEYRLKRAEGDVGRVRAVVSLTEAYLTSMCCPAPSRDAIDVRRVVLTELRGVHYLRAAAIAGCSYKTVQDLRRDRRLCTTCGDGPKDAHPRGCVWNNPL